MTPVTHVMSLEYPLEVMDLPQPMPPAEAREYIRKNAHMLGTSPQKLVAGTVLTKQHLAAKLSQDQVLDLLRTALEDVGRNGSLMLTSDLPSIHDKFLDFLVDLGTGHGLFIAHGETQDADSPESEQDRPDPDS